MNVSAAAAGVTEPPAVTRDRGDGEGLSDSQVMLAASPCFFNAKTRVNRRIVCSGHTNSHSEVRSLNSWPFTRAVTSEQLRAPACQFPVLAPVPGRCPDSSRSGSDLCGGGLTQSVGGVAGVSEHFTASDETNVTGRNSSRRVHIVQPRIARHAGKMCFCSLCFGVVDRVINKCH